MRSPGVRDSRKNVLYPVNAEGETSLCTHLSALGDETVDIAEASTAKSLLSADVRNEKESRLYSVQEQINVISGSGN